MNAFHEQIGKSLQQIEKLVQRRHNTLLSPRHNETIFSSVSSNLVKAGQEAKLPPLLEVRKPNASVVNKQPKGVGIKRKKSSNMIKERIAKMKE